MGSNLTAALTKETRRQVARRSLLDFGRLVYPGVFDDPPHIRLLAGLLERVERGELRRIMVNVPVRHGGYKFFQCHRYFPRG